jgi:hypothetical protein
MAMCSVLRGLRASSSRCKQEAGGTIDSADFGLSYETVKATSDSSPTAAHSGLEERMSLLSASAFCVL